MNGGERRERGKGSGGGKGVRAPYNIMKGKEVTVQSIGGTMFEGRFVDIWRDFVILSAVSYTHLTLPTNREV